jgi:polysaccharide export outer membrane protein
MAKLDRLALCLIKVTAALVLGLATARAADRLPAPGSQLILATRIQGIETQPVGTSGPRLTPADPNPIPAVDCVRQCPVGFSATWKALSPWTDFQEFGQGEYVGRARQPHVPVYRLRVDDAVEFAFRVDRDQIATAYKVNVGDTLSIQWQATEAERRNLVVLPDGTITLPLIGQVEAAGRTIAELRAALDDRFSKYYKNPTTSVTPTRVNSQLEELRFAIGGQAGFGSQTFPSPIFPAGTVPSAGAGTGLPSDVPDRLSDVPTVDSQRIAGVIRISPEGTVQLPAVGVVAAQGLTLDEFQTELNERYAEKIQGMEVVPSLVQHSPRYVYVLGEVARPGRYELVAPTTVMQAISMAGSWTVGAHITNVVVFRRMDDWSLMATKLDLRAALLGRTPCPEGEIWVGDTDLIIVPKSRILRTDNFIELVFTRGLYGVVPVQGTVSLFMFSNAIPPFLFPLP